MPEVKTASDLYGLPLEEFTAERNTLAKRLKAEGEKDEAARVAKLRKPSTAAWAVNQLVRTQRKSVEALFETGDQVANAQAKGQADELRETAARQRAELAGLMDMAGGLLDSEGRAPAANVLERVGETLRAAATDPESRAQVEDGCLTRELQFTGVAGFSAGAPAASAQDGRDEQKERRQEIERAQEHEKQARQELRQAEQDLREAEKDLAGAQRARDRLARKVEMAGEALDDATQRLGQLQRGGR